LSQVFLEDGKAAKDFLFKARWQGAWGHGATCAQRPKPAATVSLAIAEHDATVASDDFGWTAKAK
jgi:hypothetical protein